MTAFQETSVNAVKRFLQTIVVVDNRADYEPAVGLTQADDLVAPDEFATGEIEAQSGIVLAPGVADGPLDATALSRAFACHRLVCAILKPTQDDRMKEAVSNAAHRADILVLDWQMHDDGDLAASIVNDVLDVDGTDERLRLIAIYTSRSPLRDVAAGLAAKAPRLTNHEEDLVLTAQSTRIVLLSKGQAANAPEEQHKAVEESDLPDRLIQEFASLAQGLLSNATMAAIGGIRDHTHRILARFGPEMDGPLLTHRTLLSSPADADEFAGDMIMGELQAQVPMRRIVSEFLDEKRIREYVEHRVHGGLEPAIALKDDDGTRLFKLNVDQTCSVIEEGIAALESDS